MNSQSESSRALPWGHAAPAPVVALAAITALALALRLINLLHPALWYDELLSANFTQHGPLLTLLTVLRFDVHPPLYYLQLSLWALLGHGNLWLMSNSIAWSAGAVWLLGKATARRYGWRAGLWAAALAAVSPAALAYSDQVRMYAFLSFLLVWAWDAQNRWAEQPSKAALGLMFLSQLCVVYSHAIGLFMLCGPLLITSWTLMRAGERARLVRWLAVEALVGVCALPVVALSFSHHVSHPQAPSLSIIAQTWTELTAGPLLAMPLAAALALFTLALLVFASLTQPRAPALALVFAPLVVAALISHLLKPIWLERIFVPGAPFLALALGRWAADPPPVGRRAAPLAVGLLLLSDLVCGAVSQAVRNEGDGYRIVAQRLLETAGARDVIAARDHLELWALLWSAQGPHWGDPLHVSYPSSVWIKIMNAAPRPIQARLSTDPRPLPFGAAHVVLVDPQNHWPDPAGDVIVFSDPDNAPAVPGRVLVSREWISPLLVEHWKRPAAATAARPR